jgi:hypothetical protein
MRQPPHSVRSGVTSTSSALILVGDSDKAPSPSEVTPRPRSSARSRARSSRPMPREPREGPAQMSEPFPGPRCRSRLPEPCRGCLPPCVESRRPTTASWASRTVVQPVLRVRTLVSPGARGPPGSTAGSVSGGSGRRSAVRPLLLRLASPPALVWRACGRGGRDPHLAARCTPPPYL